MPAIVVIMIAKPFAVAVLLAPNELFALATSVATTNAIAFDICRSSPSVRSLRPTVAFSFADSMATCTARRPVVPIVERRFRRLLPRVPVIRTFSIVSGDGATLCDIAPAVFAPAAMPLGMLNALFASRRVRLGPTATMHLGAGILRGTPVFSGLALGALGQ